MVLGRWNLWHNNIGFIFFIIYSVAECERLPFVSLEVEEELVKDPHTTLEVGCKIILHLGLSD